MKTRKNIYFKVVVLTVTAIAFAMPIKAQLSDNGYANIGWQFDIPLSNNFADKAGGWGINFGGGYFVTPNLGLGLFLNYHGNHEYILHEALRIGADDVAIDQQRTIFQLSFGVTARYQWNRDGAVQPYVSVKLGVEYAKIRSSFSVLEARESSWGFYASLEVGVSIFPWVYGPDPHFALYYSYGTSKADVLHYSVGRLNNFGFRVGVSF